MIPEIRVAVPRQEPFAIINISAIQSLAGCTRAEILTFNALALHADPGGHCWPGRERLAAITQLPENRISKATAGLERKGLIRKHQTTPWRVEYYLLPQNPLPLVEPTPCQPWHPPVPPAAPRTDQSTDQTPERAATPEPATPEPAEQDPLSQVVLRTLKTPPPDTVPEDWITLAAALRPDLDAEVIQASAERFLDDRRSKGIQLACWEPSWKNWIRNERGPRPMNPSNSAHSKPWAIQQPNPYAGWEPGKKAPIGAIETPDSAIAAFERDMQSIGAVKQPNGIWMQPRTVAEKPKPVIREVVEKPASPLPSSATSQLRQDAAAVCALMDSGATMDEVRALEAALSARRKG